MAPATKPGTLWNVEVTADDLWIYKVMEMEAATSLTSVSPFAYRPTTFTMQALVLLAIISVAAASYPVYSDCYREGDIVLDHHNRCKYRSCERVEPEHGYAHFELKDKECAEGTGVPYFLLHQYMHGVYAGHRFIGSHLASTVCSDKYVKDCTAHYGYGYPGHYAPHGYPAQHAYPAEEKSE